MRSNCIYNLVHNRKKELKEKSLIQVEVIFPDLKRTYLSTGLYLPSNEWDKVNQCAVNSPAAGKLNKRFSDFITSLRDYEYDCYNKGISFTPDRLKSHLKQPDGVVSFTEWANSIINKRIEVAPGTKYLHLRAIRYLKESGTEQFSDLTPENILKFDEYIKNNTGIVKQTSLHKIHQTVSEYIDLAIDPYELILKNPYKRLKKNPVYKKQFAKGKHEIRTRLDDSEIALLIKFNSDDPEVQLIRDIAVFMIDTGIDHKDIKHMKYPENYLNNKSGASVEGLRDKTGNAYGVPILSEANKILMKYKGVNGKMFFPLPELREFNAGLKTLMKLAGIKKHITSKCLRHTFGSRNARSGISAKFTQLMMGHADPATTDIYTQLEREYLRKELQKLR